MIAAPIGEIAAPVRWCGWQENAVGLPPVELWLANAPVGGIPEDSSRSRQSFEALGFWVQPPPYSFSERPNQ